MPARLPLAALALACALAVPLRLSADAWAYAAYGALLGHGADPWSHAWRVPDVARFHDPLLAAALRAWDGSLPRDVYGPLFTVPCAVVVAATRRLGTGAPVLALRGLAAAALLACIGLAGRTRPRLAALLAYHPVVLWSAAEGHNDALWLALVLAADHVRGARARVAVLVAAVAVKAVALVPLAAALAALRGRRRLVAALVAAAALLVAYAPLAWSVAAHGLDHGGGPPRLSLLHAPALAAWAGSPVPLAAGAALALLGLAAVARALRGGDTVAGLALLGWLALPAPQAWYATWLVPVVALAGRTPASGALLAASITGLAGYAQDLAWGTASRDPAFIGGTMLALYAIPLLVALTAPAPAPTPLAPPAAAPVTSPAPAPVATTTPKPAAATAPATTTPSPAPATASPAPTAPVTPASSATPNLFGYVFAPPPGPGGMPRILEVALNDRVLHKGGPLLVRVTTSPDVTAVFARTLGREIGIGQAAPGVFSGGEQLPAGIPFFLLNRTYRVEFVASTADGRSTTTALDVRLER